ncbi:hypothetical protein C3L33_13637, partial [Rhododendron williamsianum]
MSGNTAQKVKAKELRDKAIEAVKNVKTVRSLPAVNFLDLPRSPCFSAEHLPSSFRVYRESDPDTEFLRDGFLANTRSWGSIFNSFDGLEGEYLDHLRKETEVVEKGPNGGLGSGLERSGIRFVWVVKSVSAEQTADGYGVIPNGFEDRVSGRGMMVKGWAPQISILSHQAVGGFLSHCGWNSLLEGVMAGVMILAWPMEADQFVNARLLVEDMGAAVRVCEGADSVPDSVELARTIAESMSGNTAQKNVKTVRSLPAVNFLDLPRSPCFAAEHLPSSFRVYIEFSPQPDTEFLRDGFLANIRSWGSILNSFDGLEGEYLDHLRKEMGHGRVWGVGPLSLVGGDEAMGRVNADQISGGGVLSWLDGCPDGSVLYVCFGSQKLLKRDQMEALASGLERSGIRFVWVVKSVSTEQTADGYGVIPDGFEDRVSGRGVAAGVMILAWPMEADQFVNARLLVEDRERSRFVRVRFSSRLG